MLPYQRVVPHCQAGSLPPEGIRRHHCPHPTGRETAPHLRCRRLQRQKCRPLTQEGGGRLSRTPTLVGPLGPATVWDCQPPHTMPSTGRRWLPLPHRRRSLSRPRRRPSGAWARERPWTAGERVRAGGWTCGRRVGRWGPQRTWSRRAALCRGPAPPRPLRARVWVHVCQRVRAGTTLHATVCVFVCVCATPCVRACVHLCVCVCLRACVRVTPCGVCVSACVGSCACARVAHICADISLPGSGDIELHARKRTQIARACVRACANGPAITILSSCS